MNFKKADIFSVPGIILILANIVILNLWSGHLFARLDLTQEKLYTLSDASKKMLKELDEPLTIKAYFTRELPSPYNTIPRYVQDQLEEMRAYSGSNFKFEVQDPSDSEELRSEAERFRLEPMQVNVMQQDRMEFKLVYLGLVILFEDKQEIIPAIQPQSLANLEYELISKIKRITAPKTPTIGFLEGNGEFNIRENLTSLNTELQKMYQIQPVDLTARYTIPDNIDLLCIIGSKSDIIERQRFAIDQFLMRGGKLLMAVNKVDAKLQEMQANPSGLRIDPWTEHYGFRFKDHLVMDRMSPTLPFQTQTRYGRQITMVQYPLFPEVVNFNREHPATQVLRQVRFYFPSSIDTTLADAIENVTITPLVYTSDKSSIQMAPYDINPMGQRIQYTWDEQYLPIAAVIQGKFKSYWQGKSIPTDQDGNVVSDVDIIPESPETRIVAIADANFINDQYVVPNLDNMTFILNVIDWLIADEALIGIRARDVASRPLKEVPDELKQTVKFANLLVPPIVIIAFGLVRWRWRRSRKYTV